jgi:transmembrane sensor
MSDYSDRIIDEASDWYVRLQDTEVSAADREAFTDWICASPQHVREYLSLTHLDGDISQLSGSKSVADLIELVRQGAGENVIELGPFSSRENKSAQTRESTMVAEGPRGADVGRSRVRRWVALAATTVIGVLAAGWWLYLNPNSATYTTSVGEQESFPLPDGSLVTLNAVSKLRIHYTSRYRDVRLLSGEALFTVAKNRSRPFRVLTNDSVIRAVGTQFNVYHRRADTTVTVVEGTVEVQPAATTAAGSAPPPLSDLGLGKDGGMSRGRAARALGSFQVVRVTKGQRAHVESSTAPVTVSAADPAVDIAWRERRLTFDSRPLGEVVAEFNLYNATPFEIRDESLATVQVSGSFNANDPQSFAQFLDEAGIAKFTEHSDRILLRAFASR